MHREIDAAIKERFLDLLGEQPLATHITERAVLNSVARGLDNDHLDRVGCEIMGGDEARAHLLGLFEGERAATGADAKGLVDGHHALSWWVLSWWALSWCALQRGRQLQLGSSTARFEGGPSEAPNWAFQSDAPSWFSTWDPPSGLSNWGRAGGRAKAPRHWPRASMPARTATCKPQQMKC